MFCIRSLDFVLRFIRTHFTEQLNLPVHRCENSSCAGPNTITPFDSRQNLPELLMSSRLRVTVERGRHRNQTKPLKPFCPERWLSRPFWGNCTSVLMDDPPALWWVRVVLKRQGWRFSTSKSVEVSYFKITVL